MEAIRSMMGIASSQPATQESPAVDAPAREEVTVSEGAEHINTMTPDNTKRSRDGKRSSRKLKTYSGKKRHSAGKSNMVLDDHDEVGQEPSSARAASPELGDPPSARPDTSRPHLDAQSPDAGSPVVEVEVNAANAVLEPGSDAEVQSSQLTAKRNRRDRVSRNSAFLESLKGRQSKSQKASARRNVPLVTEESTVAQSLTQQSQELSPPTPSLVKVLTWLSDQQPDEAPSEHANGRGARLNGVAHPSGLEVQENGAEEEEDQAQGQYEDGQEYDIPSDSDDVYRPESLPSPNKANSASKAKAKGKRKRDSADPPASTPAPFKKRQRKSELAVDGAAPASSKKRQKKSEDDFPTAGPFSAVEIGLVESAFDDAQEEMKIDRAEMIQKIQSSSPEVGIILSHLTQDILPNRNRKAIQRFCRRHFNDHQRGKWTQEQDDMLCAAYAERPARWVFIGQRVGRMPEDCRDRWRNFLEYGAKRNTDVWTRDEEVALAKAIADSLATMKAMLGRELTVAEEDEHISWPIVIMKMGATRNRLQCVNKWKKLRARSEREKEMVERGDFLPENDTKLDKAANLKRFKSMKLGDLVAMIKEIEYGSCLGKIDDGPTFWAVVTKMHPLSPYTTQDRKTCFKKLRPIIEDSGDFHANVEAILAYLHQDRFKEDLLERVYEPLEPSKVKKGPSRSSRLPTKGYPSAERVEESDEDQPARPNDITRDVEASHAAGARAGASVRVSQGEESAAEDEGETLVETGHEVPESDYEKDDE
ncbi:hypothetical protein BDV97DRAFT_386383 [Delphinella strobiligena]|nr:hypothetical protein BDV97DRAFT_386383 [Delphinella strobiligena]